MGRPPVPEHLRREKRRDKRIVVLVSENEMERLQDAWQAAGAATLSDWIRDVLLAATDAGGEK